jgi:hypothetical protein
VNGYNLYTSFFSESDVDDKNKRVNQDLFQYLCIHFCVINMAFGFIFSYILQPRVWKVSDVMASLSLSPARRWAGRLRISGLQASLGISFCLKHFV